MIDTILEFLFGFVVMGVTIIPAALIIFWIGKKLS